MVGQRHPARGPLSHAAEFRMVDCAWLPFHPKPRKKSRHAVDAESLLAICGGGGVNLYKLARSAWTADYLKVTDELDVDLRSNIAAEARATIVYEQLIDFCDDPDSKDTL
jgi:Mn-containing catalase